MQDKFFWGNSVSSMQTEGGWNEDGKSLSVYDVRKADENLSDWHFANDNYHNFIEDFDLMQDIGMNMYRFQISWSRVVKDGTGDWNEEGLKYYDKFIDELKKRGIEPMICLYHFDMPLYLAEKYNGFLDKKVVKAFVRFGREMVKRFSCKCKWWITFNEQSLYSQPDIAFRIAGYTKGERTTNELYQIMHNVMTAHAEISNFIHENSDAKVGGMLAYSEVYPASCRPSDVKCAKEWDEFINFSLLDCFAGRGYSPAMLAAVKNHNIDMKVLPDEIEAICKLKNDFLSFSYYASTTVDSLKIPEGTLPNYYLMKGKTKNQYIDTTEWGWQIDPLGLRDAINKIYQRYRIPVFPVENGIGVRETWDGKNAIEDDYRIKYHKDHINAVRDAMNKDGAVVLGYLGWGLIDILSSSGDMEKRYGMVYVNRGNHDLRDMKRVPKKSYYWFKNVILSNGKNM